MGLFDHYSPEKLNETQNKLKEKIDEGENPNKDKENIRQWDMEVLQSKVGRLMESAEKQAGEQNKEFDALNINILDDILFVLKHRIDELGISPNESFDSLVLQIDQAFDQIKNEMQQGESLENKIEFKTKTEDSKPRLFNQMLNDLRLNLKFRTETLTQSKEDALSLLEEQTKKILNLLKIELDSDAFKKQK